jgi:hypothetical protein
MVQWKPSLDDVAGAHVSLSMQFEFTKQTDEGLFARERLRRHIYIYMEL